MSDLSDVADVLLGRLDGLDVDRAVQRLEELTREAQAHDQALTSDWDAFWTAAVSLVERAEEETERIANAMEDAVESLGEREPALPGIVGELDRASTGAYDAADELGARVRLLPPALAEWTQRQVIEPAAALLEDAKEVAAGRTRMVEAVEAAFQENLTPVIAEHETLIGFYAGAPAVVATAGERLLRTLFEEWAGRLAGVIDLAEAEGLAPALRHVTETVADALEALEEEQKTALTEVATPVDTATAELQDLTGTVRDHGSQFEEAGDQVAAGAQRLTAALGAAATELRRLDTYLRETRFAPEGGA